MLMIFVGWAALSAGYWLLALATVENPFGREGNGNHLLGLAFALVGWMAFSLYAVERLRRLWAAGRWRNAGAKAR